MLILFSKVMIEMLRLCPADNQGTRFFLGSALIHCGRYADALYFAQQWLGQGTLDDISPSDGAIIFRAPHRNTMAVKNEGNNRTSDGSLLYTAALASFKHFGDCEQSRQYLKIAATTQPIVLVKVLARITKPGKFHLPLESPAHHSDVSVRSLDGRRSIVQRT